MSTADDRIADLEAENAALRADNGALRVQVQQLVERVAEVAARLAKDRHNSSKPPSSDPLGRKRMRSQRRRSGKQPGGQLGHRGETWHLVASPDEVVEHRPAVCTTCRTPLDETTAVVGQELGKLTVAIKQALQRLRVHANLVLGHGGPLWHDGCRDNTQSTREAPPS